MFRLFFILCIFLQPSVLATLESSHTNAFAQERQPPRIEGSEISKYLERQKGNHLPDPTNERIASSDVLTTSLLDRNIAYQAHVNRTLVYDRHDVFPPFELVSFSYESAELDRDPDRPVIFLFNGGPGSSAIWLHLTALGPEKLSVDLLQAAETGFEYTQAPNPGFLIDVADLVFVDPVGTGLSRPIENGDEAAFKGLRVDVRSMCRFAETWLEANQRTNAPVYLAGASYGSLRIAGMSTHSQCRKLRKQIRGLIFLSGLLDLTARSPSSANSHIGLFPTSAALAWDLGLIDTTKWNADLKTFLDRAKSLALSEIAPALFEDFTNTSCLAVERQTRVLSFLEMAGDLESAAQMRYLLGGIRNFIRNNRPLCQYDGRFDCGGHGHYLPSIGLPEFALKLERVLEDQLAQTMGYELDRDAYKAFRRGEFVYNWSMWFSSSRHSGLGTNMASVLHRSWTNHYMAQQRSGANPRRLKLMVASGSYDLITPFFAMELALRNAGFPGSDLEIKTYSGGHMFYLDEKTGHQLAADIRSFVSSEDDAPTPP